MQASRAPHSRTRIRLLNCLARWADHLRNRNELRLALGLAGAHYTFVFVFASANGRPMQDTRKARARAQSRRRLATNATTHICLDCRGKGGPCLNPCPDYRGVAGALHNYPRLSQVPLEKRRGRKTRETKGDGCGRHRHKTTGLS
jgi:hypothetical protein